MSFSVLLTTEMPLLFSNWLLALARLLAEPLYGSVIGHLTEVVLIPSGQGRMRIVSRRHQRCDQTCRTPHKGDPENFCLFLRLLDADVYGDVKSLEDAMQRNSAPFYLRRTKEAMVSFPDPDTGQIKKLFTKRNVQTVSFQIDSDEWDLYVPQEEVEAEVVRGLEGMMSVCADPKGFTRRVNEELRRLWEEATGHNPEAAEELKQVEAKIAHIRQAVEDGLGDAQWANERLRKLATEREHLVGNSAASTRPPQIDVGTVMAYREQVGRLFAHGKPVEKKQLLRKCVEEMKLAPERLEVEITYRVPEPVMNSVVAGAGFEPATFGL